MVRASPTKKYSMMNVLDDAQLKRAAHYAVTEAIRKGVLTPLTNCERCGNPQADRALDAHHHSGYAKEHWYDITWLCRACHIKAHPGRGPKQHTIETREKISAGVRDANATGRRRAPQLCGEKNGFFGKKHSEETRQRMRKPKKYPPKPQQCPSCDKMVYPAWLYRHGCEVARVST